MAAGMSESERMSELLSVDWQRILNLWLNPQASQPRLASAPLWVAKCKSEAQPWVPAQPGQHKPRSASRVNSDSDTQQSHSFMMSP